MKTIEAKVQVNADRTITVQLPADMQIGEYDVVLILNSSLDSTVESELSEAASEQPNDEITLRWQKWFEEVDQLPLLANPSKSNFQQHLIEKYRKQGLVL